MLPFLLALSRVTIWHCNGFDGNSDKRDEGNHASSYLSITKPLHEGEGKAASLTQEKGTADTNKLTFHLAQLVSIPRDVVGGMIWGLNTFSFPKQTTKYVVSKRGLNPRPLFQRKKSKSP